jgi:hypothetical protein
LRKIKKRNKKKELFIDASPKIKMSEIISKYASDYINMGDNTEERQNLLNTACSAWNIAVLPEHLRSEALRRNLEEYKRINPGIGDEDDLRHDMEILIQEKLRMFPKLKKAILDATIEPVNDRQYRITVISSDDPQQLKQMLP